MGILESIGYHDPCKCVQDEAFRCLSFALVSLATKSYFVFGQMQAITFSLMWNNDNNDKLEDLIDRWNPNYRDRMEYIVFPILFLVIPLFAARLITNWRFEKISTMQMFKRGITNEIVGASILYGYGAYRRKKRTSQGS